LRPGERAVIDNSVQRYLSIVSLWEIAIMQTVGRLRRDSAFLDVPLPLALLTVTGY
jgi:PIN domain nuclease of toxin-antitoxin system